MTALPFSRTKKKAAPAEAPDTVKKAAEARKEVAAQEEEARNLYDKLGEKLKRLQASIQVLKCSIDDAKRRRRDLIDLVAVDKAEQSELDAAREKVDEVMRTLTEAEEMVQAVEAARSRAAEDLSRASRNRQGADKAFWREVFGLLQTRILKAVGTDLELAWAACIASGLAHGYVGFLQALCGQRELSREKVQEILNGLEKEYGSR